MPVTHLEVLTRQSYENGRDFGHTGPYEWIEAIAHYAVDPLHEANQGITDLELLEREVDGLVHFSGDVTILRPLSATRSNRALLMQVPNRGKRVVTRFNQTVAAKNDSLEIDPGDGFLFEHGWTVAWAGWQWDVPRTMERQRIGLNAPNVPLEARTPTSQMQLRIQPNRDCDRLPLTDQHVGDLGRHMPVRVNDINEADARLLVRESAYVLTGSDTSGKLALRARRPHLAR